jgi:uncharacterized protein YhfF
MKGDQSAGPEPVVRLGNDAAEAERLAALVESHEKWATSYPLGTWPVPAPGTIIGIEHPWSKRVTRVRVQGVGVCRMSEVTLEFAAAEGCCTLAEWRRVHANFYRKTGAHEPDPAIVQQWFRAEDKLSTGPRH